MFARIARFEGGSPHVIEAETERLRREIEEIRSGRGTDSATARLGALADRVVMLTDRSGGKAATIIFCRTEEQLREVDRIMQGMSPQAGEGHRSSYDLYEVALDEALSDTAKAA